MRFGIKTAPQHTSYADMRDVWTAADDIEIFESAWSFDHFYPIFSDSTGPCLEGWTTLAALAEATSRIRIGLMVTGMPYRHPAVLAKMAAAVDVVSEGRLDLGLGAGWNEEEADAYGISLGESIGERMDMFDEGVEAVVNLMSRDVTTLRGSHVELREARNEPKGPQTPHPPIVIGGGGEKRTLRTAARWAQHWNLPFGDVAEWKHKRAVLDAHCDDLGRDPAEIIGSVQVRVSGAEDFGGVAEDAADLAEAGVDKIIYYLELPHTPAILDPLASALSTL